MNIVEATKKALEENKCIIRESFEQTLKIDVSTGVLRALNTDGSLANKKGPSCWNPTHFDLVAEDWLAID